MEDGRDKFERVEGDFDDPAEFKDIERVREITCEEVLKLTSAILAGEISEEEREMVDHHVANCKGCFEDWKTLSQAWVCLGDCISSNRKSPVVAKQGRFFGVPLGWSTNALMRRFWAGRMSKN